MKVDHIGIVVKDLEAATAHYTAGLGLKLSHVHEAVADRVKIAFLPVGESQIELLQPTDDTTGVARFLEKRGEGIHHICLEVTDMAAALRQAEAAGLELIDKTPRQGAEGKVAFLHPRSLNGVLIEFVEK